MKSYLLAYVLLLLIQISKVSAQQDFGWQTNGPVYASLIKSRVLYIAGNFSYVGKYYGTSAGVSEATGIIDTRWPRTDIDVQCIIPDGAGGYFIGGQISNAGGVPRSRVAHILADKTVDPDWRLTVNNTIRNMIIVDNMLFLGGDFTQVNGQTRNRLASVDVRDGALSLWNPNANGSVYSLTHLNGVIYVGGDFSAIGNIARTQVAAIDIQTGVITSWNPVLERNGASFGINAIAASSAGNSIFIGGNFITCNAEVRNGLVEVDAIDGRTTSWNPKMAVGSNIFCITAINNSLYTGGFINSINGQTRRNIALLDATTGSLEAWNPNVNGGAVLAISYHNNTIYASGQFTSVGGQIRNKVAAIDASTGAPTSWNPNAGNGWEVHTITPVPGTGAIFFGGSITSVNGFSRSNFAAIDLNTDQVLPINPAINNVVNALAERNGIFYLGGDFTSVAGQARSRLAAINTSGTLQSWNPTVNGSVKTLFASGDSIYFGGLFSMVNGEVRNNVAAATTSNNLLGWRADFDNQVNTIAVDKDIVYIGGAFLTVNGESRSRLAALDINGNLTAWNPAPNNTVRSLAVYNNTVYTGGDFTTVIDQYRSRIAAININGTLSAWNPGANGVVRSVFIANNKCFIGGDFSSAGGSTRRGVAAIDITATFNNLREWNPFSNLNSVYTVAIENTNGFAGGGFYMTNSSRGFFLASMPDMEGVLNLESKNLTVSRHQSTAHLQWAVDRNAKFLVIEKSTDQKKWVAIEKGNIDKYFKDQAYQFIDEKPVAGRNWYRIQFISGTDPITYSNIVSVQFTNIHQNEIMVMPTLVNAGYIKVQAGEHKKPLEISIFSISGSQIHTTLLYDQVQSINVSSLSKGVYIITVSSQGEILKTSKVNIQ